MSTSYIHKFWFVVWQSNMLHLFPTNLSLCCSFQKMVLLLFLVSVLCYTPKTASFSSKPIFLFLYGHLLYHADIVVILKSLFHCCYVCLLCQSILWPCCVVTSGHVTQWTVVTPYQDLALLSLFDFTIILSVYTLFCRLILLNLFFRRKSFKIKVCQDRLCFLLSYC